MDESERIIIGRIGAAHGLNGVLRVISLSDFEGRFENLKEVWIENKLFEVEKSNCINERILVKFAGINNREEAKVLTNKFLKIDRKYLAPLKDGEFYVFDVIGCDVFENDENIGIVTNVLKTASNDVFEVKGRKTFLIPALKKIVKSINIESKKISIDSKYDY